MNVGQAAHLSGQMSGQTAQMNQVPGAGVGVGVGAADGMPQHQPMQEMAALSGTDQQFVMLRTAMREKIFDYIGRKQSSAEWRKRLPELAKRLEEILYRKFPNKTEYYNMMKGPVEPQLQFAIKTLSAQNQHNQQNPAAGRGRGRVSPQIGDEQEMAINSGGGGSCSGRGEKRQRVDGLDDRCEAVGSDAIRADRISALPDELRLRVLTHLTLKDAIRTGVLARGWRGLWKGRWAHRTSLEVHLCSRGDTQRELDALAREPHPRRRLERFSLNVDTCKLKSSEFQRFLGYATECGVEDLHVETHTITAASKLKFHMPLSSPSLVCLSLRCITVSMFYKGTRRPFRALEVIRLVSVSFRPEAFKKMMARCPSLRTLDLRGCSCNGWVFDRLPPNLRSLTIADCDTDRLTSLDFVPVPTLRSFRYSGRFSNLPLSIPRDATLSDLYVRLYDSVPMKEWNMDKLRKSLPKDLSSLSVLTINHKALTRVSVLSADGASAQLLNFNIHSLKELHLLMLGSQAVDLPNLYLFLKTFQCPNLERLFVQLPAYRDEPMKGSIDQVWEEPPERGLDNLVMVKVMNFNWCPTEVQLVSFLLRKASSLQKLLIVSCNVTPVDSPGAPEADRLLLKEALGNGKIVLTESDNAATQPYHEAFIKVL